MSVQAASARQDQEISRASAKAVAAVYSPCQRRELLHIPAYWGHIIADRCDFDKSIVSRPETITCILK
jgi:hypothetical protein